jgi:septal ring factor EnvC (AmiA/AmiB activator)
MKFHLLAMGAASLMLVCGQASADPTSLSVRPAQRIVELFQQNLADAENLRTIEAFLARQPRPIASFQNEADRLRARIADRQEAIKALTREISSAN